MTNPMLVNELAKPFQRPLVRLLCNCSDGIDLPTWQITGEPPHRVRSLKRNMKVEENRFHIRGEAAAGLVRF